MSATCPYTEPARSNPYPHIPLPSYYYPTIYAWVSQLDSYPQVSPPKPYILLSPILATFPAHPILHDFITRTIFGEQYTSLSPSLCSFLHSLVTSSLLGPNILLNTLILKHPQPTFLPLCERPSFTPIQNRQNYSSVFTIASTAITLSFRESVVCFLTLIYLLVECGTVEDTSLTARGLWPLRRFGRYRKCYIKSAVTGVLQQVLEKHHFRLCCALCRTVHWKKASVYTSFLCPVLILYPAHYWYIYSRTVCFKVLSY